MRTDLIPVESPDEEDDYSEDNGNGKHEPPAAEHRAMRRRAVAGLYLRGVTLREIVTGLATAGIRNPKSKKGYTLNTVQKDLKWLEGEWQQDAKQDTQEQKAVHLAKIREAFRQAWTPPININEVRQLLKNEAELLGLENPKKVDLSGNIEVTFLNSVGEAVFGSTNESKATGNIDPAIRVLGEPR